MKRTLLLAFSLLLTNYQIVTSQFTSQIFQQQFINRPIENNADSIVFQSPNIISNNPIEFVENFVYAPPNVIPNRPVGIVENIVYPNVINEQICNGVPLPPAQEYVPSGNTILITDCTPSACQNLADTLQLMIVCNMLQNTQRGKEFALQLAGPVINQLISSPVLSCGCPNPVFPSIDASNPTCPNFLPNIFSPTIVTSDGISGPIFDLGSNLVSLNNAPVPSCSCQTLSGTVSSCPCQACAAAASPSCSCQIPSPLFSCQNCLASPSNPCQKYSGVSSYSCQKCSAPAPTSPCQACSSSEALVPPPPPPAQPCACETYTVCPNNLNSFLSSICQKCSGLSPCPCQKCSAPATSCPCQACSSSAPPPPPPAPSCACQACKACPNNLNSMLSSFLNFL